MKSQKGCWGNSVCSFLIGEEKTEQDQHFPYFTRKELFERGDNESL